MAALAALAPLGRHLVSSMLLYGAGFVLMAAMLRAFPPGLTERRAFALVFALGLAARLAFLFLPPASDLYRYIWEGAVQNHGVNPYLLAPDSRELAPLARGSELGAIWGGINHKWLSAAYPPFALLLFRLMAAVSPTPLFFKSVFLLADLGLVALLALMLRARGLPCSRLLLYAANPLAVVFTAGEGHFDVLQALLLCLAVFMIGERRFFCGSLLLGLAVMTKYLAAAALPFLIRREGRAANLAVLLPLVLFLPFAGAGARLFGSLDLFGAFMHFNDSAAALLRVIIGPGANLAAAGCLALCLAWVWLTEDDDLRAVYLGTGCLLVFLPTVHPWYLLLIAPLLCFFPSRAWLYLQAAVLFTFPVMAYELEHKVFVEIQWLKILEYLPFFGMLLWGAVHGGHVAPKGGLKKPAGISAVIPALNEAPRIVRCLEALQREPEVREVIVADGGSTDGTLDAARSRGAKTVAAATGRGLQIRAGAAVAQEDVLWVLHADCVPEPGAAGRVLSALGADGAAAGGCFGMAFETGGLRSALVAGLNNLRAAATGISFGDQAQFVRAEALARIGGFPAQMLMEDVELSLRVKPVGRMLYLGRGVAASARGWGRGGAGRRIATILGLFFRYLVDRRLGRSRRMDAVYFGKYYGVEKNNYQSVL
jgi:rSAM/selenodomain-associated transferase 2